MPQDSLRDLGLKLGLGQPGADLLLERNPPERRVLNALYRHLANRLADAGHGNRQEIHQKSGVDSRRQHGNAMLFRQFVDFLHRHFLFFGKERNHCFHRTAKKVIHNPIHKTIGITLF